MEKMMVLQSHLVDLYPPEKEEDDDPDGAGISKQLMADALSLAWSRRKDQRVSYSNMSKVPTRMKKSNFKRCLITTGK